MNEVGEILAHLMEARGINGPEELAAVLSDGRYEFSAGELRRVLEGQVMPGGPLRYRLLVGLDQNPGETYDLSEALIEAIKVAGGAELAEQAGREARTL
jgi:hypothetical protein